MERINLRKAANRDKAFAIQLDYRLEPDEHVSLNREEKIAKAILDDECYIILADDREVGFIIFDYRFFDQGWIELIIVEENSRGKGIGGQAMNYICELSKTSKVFTSTNRSNTQMQRALSKIGFTFAGEIYGLDEGDPELFYYKTTNNKETDMHG